MSAPLPPNTTSMVSSRGWRKQRGGKEGARHFHHVHLHYNRPPRRVCLFSPLWSLLPRSSLLSCVLIPPVLFSGVLVAVVSYVWLTLFYFVASLLNKDRKLESSKDGGGGGTRRGASDAGRCRREDDRRAKAEAVGHVAELVTGDSLADGVSVQSLEIKEVHVDGFSEVSSSYLHSVVRTNEDDELVEEAIILETSREEIDSNADFEEVSERPPVHQYIPIDRFLDELNIREVSTSGDVFPTLFLINSAENKQIMVVPSISSSHHYVGDKHEQYGEEFVADRKELSACSSSSSSSSSETCDFIDKHENPSYGSAHGGIRDVQNTENTEKKYANGLLEFLVGIEDFDEQREIQKVVVHDSSKFPEVIIEANKKQCVCASDEVHDLTETELNETSGISVDSLCEDRIVTTASSNAWSNHHIGDEDDKNKKLIITNTIEEASGTASTACELGDNHQTTSDALDGFASGNDIGGVASSERTFPGGTGDEHEKINENCTSKGVPCRFPLARGTPAPWWNLCGVLDAFGGCED